MPKRAGFRKRIKRTSKTSVKSLKRSIKKIQNREELKYLPLDVTPSMTIAGTTTLLNASVQGDTAQQRSGLEFVMTSLQFRFSCLTDEDLFTSTFCRLVFVYDKQPNGALPSVGSVLDTNGGIPVYLAPYNREYQKRFKILYDKSFTLTPQILTDFDPATGLTTTVGRAGKLLSAKIPLGKIVKCSGTAGTIADIQTGSLFCITISDQGVNVPTTDIGTRIYFKDD